MAHSGIIMSTSEITQQARAYFKALSPSIPWARRIEMEAAYVAEHAALRDRHAQRCVPSATQYQTGPRYGQQLADSRAAKRQVQG